MQKFMKVVLVVIVIFTVLIINGIMSGLGIRGAIPMTILVCGMFLAIRTIWRYNNPCRESETEQSNKSAQTLKAVNAEPLVEPVNYEPSKKIEQPEKEPSIIEVGLPSNKQSEPLWLQDDTNSNPQNISNVEQKILALEKAEIPVVRPSNINSDSMYEQALKEIEDNKPHKASWARAFSETEGDEIKTKALYIKLRVAHLQEGHRQEEERRLNEERRAQDLREQELQRSLAVNEEEKTRLKTNIIAQEKSPSSMRRSVETETEGHLKNIKKEKELGGSRNIEEHRKRVREIWGGNPPEK